MSISDADRSPVLAHEKFIAEQDVLAPMTLVERFAYIHKTNLWGANSSTSGLGSEHSSTKSLRAELPRLIASLAPRTLLDAPCGDAAWISGLRLDGINYIGIDVVPEIIELNQRDRRGLGRFLLADMTRDRLPAADTILCRDCLVHLSFSNIELALGQIRKTGAEWLITTTFTQWQQNQDCVDADWRPLNLELPPFSWPAPSYLLNEECDEAGGTWADKSLGVWRVSDVSRSKLRSRIPR